jgi:hypothetical protein
MLMKLMLFGAEVIYFASLFIAKQVFEEVFRKKENP